MGCHVIARRKFCVGIGYTGDAHTHTDQISQFFTTQAHTAAGKAKVGDTLILPMSIVPHWIVLAPSAVGRAD